MSSFSESGAHKSPLPMIDSIKWDLNGLIPAVVQDAGSKDTLMLAYMNREALRITVKTGEAWFWSRSRGELWHKGASSGSILHVKSIKIDCDQDTLLLLVDPAGPVCHTGNYSCFFQEIAPGTPTRLNGTAGAEDQTAASESLEILTALESIIARRDAERPAGAYTTYLFEKGIDKILKKVGEETAEVIIAAKNRDNDELRYETSDLIFHLLVLLREAKLPLSEVMEELDRRHAKGNSQTTEGG